MVIYICKLMYFSLRYQTYVQYLVKKLTCLYAILIAVLLI